MGIFNIFSSKRTDNPKQISVSFESETPQPYSTVLNQLEKDVSYIAAYANGYGEISVVVIIQKKDDNYCEISGSFLADSSFREVVFGKGYNYNGSDFVTFKATKATGFTTLEAAKRELALQFHWDNLQVYDEKYTMLDKGDFANKPYISYEFKVKK